MLVSARSNSHVVRANRGQARLGALVAISVMLVAAGACTSSGPSSTSAQQQVVHLLEEAGFPAATATCATRRMYAALSKADLARLASQASQGADAVDGTLRGKVADAVRACVSPASDSGATPGTALGASSPTDGG